MPSLADAYDAHDGEVSRERVYLGTGLFALGALLAVLGLVFGTTGLLPALGLSIVEAREIAGTLAGLGVPAVFVGIFAVLPASQVQRAAAAIGASLAVLGVMLFRHAYWEQWSNAAGTPTGLTLLVALVYFLGTIVTFWCLFTAVATFKRRNDPGGTVTLTFTRGGETRTVEVAESSLDEARKALGGVGVFGGVDDPDGPALDDATVTTAGAPAGTGAAGATTGPAGPASPTSDGGAATESDLSSPLDDDGEVLGREAETPPTDRYCGNCSQFEYVRTGDGMQPYCGVHDELMDDMEACEDWVPNRR